MKNETSFSALQEQGCKNCISTLNFDFTFAFQPIVDVKENKIFAYEALVRGVKNESAGDVLAKVNNGNRYLFDQECRKRSIMLAKKLNIASFISINFLPNAVYKPELCIRSTIAAADAADFPLNQIIFEVSESENVHEPEKLLSILNYYRKVGFLTAIDDFGAGYAGLGLLSDFQPDYIKLDIKLVRNIESSSIKQAIVKGIISTCQGLNIHVIAEGVETHGEAAWFHNNNINLLQGFYFAKPGFQILPPVLNYI